MKKTECFRMKDETAINLNASFDYLEDSHVESLVKIFLENEQVCGACHYNPDTLAFFEKLVERITGQCAVELREKYVQKIRNLKN